MSTWTKARRVRETINLANHRHGWNPNNRVLGGDDDATHALLTTADELVAIWSKCDRNAPRPLASGVGPAIQRN